MRILLAIAALALLLIPSAWGQAQPWAQCWHDPPTPATAMARLSLLSGAAERYRAEVTLGAAALGWQTVELAWLSDATPRSAVKISSIRLACTVRVGTGGVREIPFAVPLVLEQSVDIPGTGPLPRLTILIDEPSPGQRRLYLGPKP